jgi:hypothetical protein
LEASVATRHVRALIVLCLVGMLLPIGRGYAQSQRPGTLFPFSPPWDDASPGPTDLSGWNRPIEGEADRLRAGHDGHFYRGAERVRLFGFNLSAGAPMTDRGVAERVAARLSKFGVNYVRIAQNSQPAPQGWIDPATLAGVDPEALDRLDYFIAQLRRRGIYVHLVLNHFRRLYPRDVPGFETGRALPDGWPRWGTGVTQFFIPLIAQNRAISRQILTHRNPHTGLTYAEDPAIAVVEITNEDGLTRLWRGGAIDPIMAAGAPHLVPLRDELARRWNRWLRERYGTDADLRAAWSRGALPGGRELLANGDLGQGTHGWRLATSEGARARWQIAPGAGPVAGTQALQIQVERVGTEPWHVMVVQDRLPLRKGRPYRVGFWVRASGAGAKMALNVRQGQSPGRALSSTVELPLSDRWEQRTLVVTPTASEANATVNFILGYQVQTVWLAGISVQEAAVLGLREDESASAGSVPAFSRAEFTLRTPRAQQDWMAFLFATEERFFADELRFLRDELKVRALLVGTQSHYSPSTVQAMFDVVSMHAYWTHPSFPGRPWDPDNWYVRNRSMVNARDEWHTIGQIAFRRWAGKPLVVDEYNHPQPNTFGAEGFPLVAAYGAFQDWDGIAGWAYHEGWLNRWLAEDDWARPVIRHHFSLDTDPVKMISAWLAAVVFRRGDVAPGRHLVPVGLTPDQDQEIARTVGVAGAHEGIGRGMATLPLRFRIALQPAAPPAPQVSPADAQAPIVSEGGELTWETRRDGRGVVTVDSPRAKMVIGFGGRPFALGDVTITPGPTAQQGFGVWAVVALDGDAPIGLAHRLIVVALGHSQNTNMGWTIYPDQQITGLPPEGARVTVARRWGEAPVLVEGVPARIVLPATAGNVSAWALDERGQRKNALPVRLEGGRPVVEIGADHGTVWYEVAIGGP